MSQQPQTLDEAARQNAWEAVDTARFTRTVRESLSLSETRAIHQEVLASLLSDRGFPAVSSFEQAVALCPGIATHRHKSEIGTFFSLKQRRLQCLDCLRTAFPCECALDFSERVFCALVELSLIHI